MLSEGFVKMVLLNFPTLVYYLSFLIGNIFEDWLKVRLKLNILNIWRFIIIAYILSKLCMAKGIRREYK